MSTEKQVYKLFLSALELETDERGAFLDRVCHDPSVRLEVESLIRASELAEAEDFLTGAAREKLEHQDPLIGRTLGDFIIRSELGEGGFGVVYLAEQLSLQREAVVKVLHKKHRSNKGVIDRFFREARLASRLEHPYTAHVYAFGAEADGILWIAMEMVHGTPLDRFLKSGGPIPINRFVLLLDKISEVVQTAHEYGIIHRDLKPENIMVITRAGRLLPKLLDFGIAKFLYEESTDTDDESSEFDQNPGLNSMFQSIKKTEGALGSASYMPPEQWDNTTGITARADIYALGVLSYEAITSRRPFSGDSLEEVRLLHKEMPVPPLGPTFPAALDLVMAKVMAKRPEDRYQTAIQFATAFREAAEQRAVIQQSEIESEERSPYPGLSTFTSDDAEFFFGRERETVAFLNRLQIVPLLVVLGPSGSGKSSFIQAGVIPALEGWQVITTRPGHSPLATLSACLVRDGIEVRNLRVALEHNPNALGEALRASAERSGTKLLLFIDQFEELFTLSADQVEQRLFAEAISRAARSAEEPVRVVITLRDDFLMRAQRMPLLSGRLSQGLQLLNTPDRQDLLQILIEPACRAGYEFEDRELPREIVDSVAEQAGALPLVAFTAARLWESRERQARLLVRRAYAEMGGVGGALAKHAEEMMGQMTREEQRLVRETFRHLVTGEGTRALLTREELNQVLGGGPRADAVVEKLIEARLLVASEGEGGIERVEIAHEALLSAWPRLVRWRQEDIEGTRLRDQLRTAVRHWEERGRVKGLLWRDEALIEYQLWRSRYAGKLTETEEAFGKASLAEAARNRQKRRLAAILSSFTLIAGLIVLLWMNRQMREALMLAENNARRADEQRQLSEKNAGLAEDSARKRRRQLFELYIEQGRQELLNGNAPLASVYLSEAYKEIPGDPVLRFLVSQAVQRIPLRTALLADHKDIVNSAAYSLDNKRIVTASKDKTAKIWDASSGRLLVSLIGHKDNVLNAKFSPDGKYVVTVSSDRTAKLWNAANGTFIATLVGAGPTARIQSASFSPDSKYIVTAISVSESQSIVATDEKIVVSQSPDNTAKVWEAASGRLLFSLYGHTKSVNFATFSPDGRYIVTVSDDRTAKVWNATNGMLLNSFEEHTAPVTSAAFYPDSTRTIIVTVGHDNTMRIWDPIRSRQYGSFYIYEGTDQTGKDVTVTFSPNGMLIATSDELKTKLWDFSPSKLLTSVDSGISFDNDISLGRGKILDNNNDRASNYNLFIPDSSRIAAVNQTGNVVRRWNAVTSDKSLSKTIASFEGGNGRALNSSIFSPDSSRIVTAYRWGNVIKVWDTASAKQLLSSSNPAGGIDSISFSPDGTRIVAASKDKTAMVWDAVGSRVYTQLEGHKGAVDSAVFSPDCKLVLTAGRDNTAMVWDAESGRLLTTLIHYPGLADKIYSAAFSPDGTRIVTSGNNSAKLWETATGKLLFSFDISRLLSALFSPDGKLIATTSWDGKAKIWDVASGRALLSFDIHSLDNGSKGRVVPVVFSPDGKFVAGTSKDGTVKVWSSSSGKLVTSLVGHKERVSSIVFSPDGTRIYTGSLDKIVRVWEAVSGRLLNTINGHTCQTDPTGKYIVTSDYNTNTITIWDSLGTEPIASIDGYMDVNESAIFSPDGARIVTMNGNIAKVWESASGRLLALLDGHKGPVTTAIFSPDGARIVTSSLDNRAKIWDVRLETRSPDEITEIVRRFVPFRLEQGRLISSTSNK
jgi:WD40 repeat protein/serine/threonine protein kinase